MACFMSNMLHSIKRKRSWNLIQRIAETAHGILELHHEKVWQKCGVCSASVLHFIRFRSGFLFLFFLHWLFSAIEVMLRRYIVYSIWHLHRVLIKSTHSLIKYLASSSAFVLCMYTYLFHQCDCHFHWWLCHGLRATFKNPLDMSEAMDVQKRKQPNSQKKTSSEYVWWKKSSIASPLSPTPRTMPVQTFSFNKWNERKTNDSY